MYTQTFSIIVFLVIGLVMSNITCSSNCQLSKSNPQKFKIRRPKSRNPRTKAVINVPDHPEWSFINGIPWYEFEPTQQDHARLHAYLSMSTYGDYKQTCPLTFTKGFSVLEEFSTAFSQLGYTAWVPEMRKIVIVFTGFRDYSELDWSPVSIEDLVSNCTGCMAASGVRNLYVSAKEATDDFKIAREAVNRTGLLFSVTGHGVGGSVAALAALDLGARNLVHYSHNQGMPRSFNYEAVVRYDNLFQVLSGQSLVNQNDFMVHTIPMGTFYHLGSKVHLQGPKQQWLMNCYGNNENATCLGNGTNPLDHQSYFTPMGSCGSADKGF
ncbi:hypothetical protein DFH28DRAFT_1105984 [Melampsora americana]|nr:hypothetical protein DFH28DRAFT_1105984 [Melampsora americana]